VKVRVALNPTQSTNDSSIILLVLYFWYDIRFSIEENPVDPRRNRYGQSRDEMFGTGCCTRIIRGSYGRSGAGLLFAPKTGEEACRVLKGYARRAEKEVLEKAEEARAAPDETIGRGKHFLAEKTADAEEAVKAGRETMKEKMDKCCSDPALFMTVRGKIAEPRGLAPTSAAVPVPLLPRSRAFLGGIHE
jgi:gas vesicle protein